MDPLANKERTLDAVAAFNRGDIDAYLASYSPDVVIHGLPAPLPPTRDGHRLFVEALRIGLPDVIASIHQIVLRDDLVALRMTYTGTHEGVLRGVPATGRRLEWEGMTFRRYGADGLTVERWLLGDTMSLIAQLEGA
jgi:steroid delta-isomerase-like uncharacterized protein